MLALLRSGAAVHGLAHITGDGLLNLRRLSAGVGFAIDAPLPVPGVCRWLCELGAIGDAEAYRIFNMGCGFVAVVAAADAPAAALALLADHHPGRRPDRPRQRQARAHRAAGARCDALDGEQVGEREPAVELDLECAAVRAAAPRARSRGIGVAGVE